MLHQSKNFTLLTRNLQQKKSALSCITEILFSCNVTWCFIYSRQNSKMPIRRVFFIYSDVKIDVLNIWSLYFHISAETGQQQQKKLFPVVTFFFSFRFSPFLASFSFLLSDSDFFFLFVFCLTFVHYFIFLLDFCFLPSDFLSFTCHSFTSDTEALNKCSQNNCFLC